MDFCHKGQIHGGLGEEEQEEEEQEEEEKEEEEPEEKVEKQEERNKWCNGEIKKKTRCNGIHEANLREENMCRN